MNHSSIGPIRLAIILAATIGLLGCGEQSKGGKGQPSGGTQTPTPATQAKPDETDSAGGAKNNPPKPATPQVAPSASNYEIRRFVVEFPSKEGPFGENVYLVIEKALKQGLIVDPGKRSPELEKAVLDAGITIKGILNTHGHRDHIGANGAYAKQYHADVYGHSGDKALYGTGANQPSRWISAEGALPIGDMQVRVICTPGHTAGSVCFLIGGNLLSGDTLFKGDVGRTDDEAAERLMVGHIRAKLFPLPPETPVFPGHEDLTSIAAEKKDNPCVEDASISSGANITPATYDAWVAFDELERGGGPRVVTPGKRGVLLIPWGMRFRSVSGKWLIESVAFENGLEVAWVRDGRCAVLYASGHNDELDLAKKNLAAEDARLARTATDLQSQDVQVRREAAGGLSVMEREKALPLIGKALDDSDATVRASAVWALRRVKREDALAPLEKAMADKDAFVRRAAAMALGSVKGDKALLLLEKALADQDAGVRNSAAGGLGVVGGEKSLELLKKLLESQDSGARGAAARALGYMDDAKALKLIEKALGDEDAAVRQAAADALGGAAGEKGLGLIEKALADKDKGVRWNVVAALGCLGSDKAQALLGKTLDSQDAHMRRAAASALSCVSGEKVLPLIGKALADQDEGVRGHAAPLLRRMRTGKGLALVEKALNNKDPEVARIAGEVVEKLRREVRMEVDKTIAETVQRKIHEGFESRDEIIRDVVEMVEEEFEVKDSKKQVTESTDRALAEHAKLQATWLTPTDCDKLDAGFAALEKQGVVARQNFTCCQTCGHAEIGDEIKAFAKTGKPIGYTFYHMQDTESAAEGGGLYLAYGSVGGTDEDSVKIGKMIVKTLTENGLKVEWDGKLKTRIFVKDLVWHKRRK